MSTTAGWCSRTAANPSRRENPGARRRTLAAVPLAVSHDFVLAHTRARRPTLVPELSVRVAADVVALWEAIEREHGADSQAGCTQPAQAFNPPFWAAAWPGGQALARYVLDHPESVAARTVLDLGSGSGLVALAAARAGAARVVASDVDPFCPAAIALNAAANDVTGVQIVGDVLDAELAPDIDVVLAGDVCYDRGMTDRVLPFLHAARRRGCDVLLGDPGRAYLPRSGLEFVAAYDVPEVDALTSRRATVRRVSAGADEFGGASPVCPVRPTDGGTPGAAPCSPF